LVRGTGDPSALAAPIRRIVQAIDPTQPLFDVELLESRVSQSLAERRERAAVLGTFAALALLIAVVGIYGVMSYSVTRRTHEIGIRMALGAGRSDVLRMVVASGLRMAAFGMAIGLAGALFITRILKRFYTASGLRTEPLSFWSRRFSERRHFLPAICLHAAPPAWTPCQRCVRNSVRIPGATERERWF